MATHDQSCFPMHVSKEISEFFAQFKERVFNFCVSTLQGYLSAHKPHTQTQVPIMCHVYGLSNPKTLKTPATYTITTNRMDQLQS